MVCPSCQGITNCLPSCSNKYHVTPEVEFYDGSQFLLIDLEEDYQKKMPELQHHSSLPWNSLSEPPQLHYNHAPGVFEQIIPNPLIDTQHPPPLTNHTSNPTVDWLTDQSLVANDFRFNGNEENIIDEFLEQHGDLDIEFNADTSAIEDILYYTLNDSVHNILLGDVPMMENEFIVMYEYDFDPNERFDHIAMYK